MRKRGYIICGRDACDRVAGPNFGWMLLTPLLLLGVQVVEALLVGFGDVGQTVDESERFSKSRGGISESRGRLLF